MIISASGNRIFFMVYSLKGIAVWVLVPAIARYSSLFFREPGRFDCPYVSPQSNIATRQKSNSFIKSGFDLQASYFAKKAKSIQV